MKVTTFELTFEFADPAKAEEAREAMKQFHNDMSSKYQTTGHFFMMKDRESEADKARNKTTHP